MTFDEWYAREGALMAHGGCSAETVARAAFFVATNEEREACAKVCEKMHWTAPEFNRPNGVQCARTIRARFNVEVKGAA
jgi:hypothetical protein